MTFPETNNVIKITFCNRSPEPPFYDQAVTDKCLLNYFKNKFVKLFK